MEKSILDTACEKLETSMPLEHAFRAIAFGLIAIVAWTAVSLAVGVRMVWRFARRHWRKAVEACLAAVAAAGFFFVTLAACWMLLP